MKDTVIVTFEYAENDMCFDMEVPLFITANDLINGLNSGLKLGIDTNNISECYLCVEEPRFLLRGDITLDKFGLRDGSRIIYRG